MKVTFINQIADLCEKVGADVQHVARGIGLDKRIAAKFLHAGPGYGGSCFPKDTLALVKTAQDAGAPVTLIEQTIAANEKRKKSMADKIAAAMGGAAARTVAILGLTFKPKTDDMRDAPSLDIVPALQAAGAKVRAFDPEGMHEARKLLPGLETAENAYAAANGADALVILTEWDQFRALDFARLKAAMKSNVVVDLRNVYDPAEVRRHGFAYTSIGRV